MKAGMFGYGDKKRITLWVNSDGAVVNGNWTVTYHPGTDEVSYKNGPRYQRICDVSPVLNVHPVTNPGDSCAMDYNRIMDAHQKMVDEKTTS
jgi:hypothetical protein